MKYKFLNGKGDMFVFSIRESELVDLPNLAWPETNIYLNILHPN